MTAVTFEKSALYKLTKKKMPDQLLSEKLSMLGIVVDEVTPTTITIDVTPNRPDLLSVQGLARALRTYLGLEKGMRKYKIIRGKGVVHIDPNLRGIRPFTACCIVRKLKLDEEKLKEIIDVQEKMHGTYGRKRKRCAIGIYPLKAIELPIYFEARSPSDIVFTPLDYDKPLPSLQILKEHPKGKDYAHLLFGFKNFPIFVDSAGAVLSLVPIVNSQITGKVTPDTKEVFIEVSGHNFEVCHKALLMLAAMFADMGGVVESMELKYGTKKIRTPDFTPTKMKLTAARVNKTLGTDLKQPQINQALKLMGFDAVGTTISVPAFRSDILHEVDLIEDVAIGHGYNNLKPTIPQIATVGNESRTAILERTIRELLIGQGMLEVKTYCLSSPQIQLQKTYQIRRVVEMENSLTADYSILRHMIIPNLLDVLSRNKHNEYPQMLFEIGTVWTPEEEPRLGFVLCAEKGIGFTEARRTVETLLRGLGRQLTVKPLEDKLFISGRAAVFPGGFFGEIHPQVLLNFNIPYAVVAGEIRFKEIVD